MTLLVQLNAWQEEIRELQDQLGQGLPSDIDQEILHCATAVSSAREVAAGRCQEHEIIPRVGKSERRIDLSIRSYLETNGAESSGAPITRLLFC